MSVGMSRWVGAAASLIVGALLTACQSLEPAFPEQGSRLTIAQGLSGPDCHEIREAKARGDGFVPTGGVLLQKASVPDAIGDPGGLLLYYVNGESGSHGIFVAREAGPGRFDVLGPVTLDGGFNSDAVDPDVVRLPDGRLRLFYYIGGCVSGPKPRPGAPHLIYSAISDDGINFATEDLVFSLPVATDPTVIRLADSGSREPSEGGDASAAKELSVWF